MFISGAFSPLETMPAWLRTMAAFNPVAHAIDALRGTPWGRAPSATPVSRSSPLPASG
jgi:ABC-2 type transport system permease protein